MLIIALCVSNFGVGLSTFYVAVACIEQDHPFGIAGCRLSFGVAIGLTMLVMTVQAVISYERRMSIFGSSSIGNISTRIYTLLASVVVISFVFSSIVYGVLDSVRIVSVRFDRNSSDTIDICSLSALWFPGFVEIATGVVALHLPLAITIFNYL